MSSPDFSLPSSPEFQWETVRELGRGSYGIVLHVRSRTDPKKERALKIIEIREKDERLANEIRFHRMVCPQTPYVVQIEDVFVDSQRLFILMELCWGTLADLLQRNGGRLPEALIHKFSRHLAEGLACLRRLEAVHRDLKPENMLITSPDPAQAVLKLADLGFARGLKEHAMAYSLVGSPHWMAPEIAIDRKYTSQADLWSVGAVIYQMVSGSPPPNAFRDLREFVMNHMKNRYLPVPISPEMRTLMSPPLFDLLTRLLEKNPSLRISFTDFIAHPWLAFSQEEIRVLTSPLPVVSSSSISSSSPSPTQQRPSSSSSQPSTTTTTTTTSPSASPSSPPSSSPSPSSPPSSSPSPSPSPSPPASAPLSTPPSSSPASSPSTSRLSPSPSPASSPSQAAPPQPLVAPPSLTASPQTDDHVSLREVMLQLEQEKQLRVEYEHRVEDTKETILTLLHHLGLDDITARPEFPPSDDYNRTFFALDQIVDLFIQLQNKVQTP